MKYIACCWTSVIVLLGSHFNAILLLRRPNFSYAYLAETNLKSNALKFLGYLISHGMAWCPGAKKKKKKKKKPSWSAFLAQIYLFGRLH